MEGFANQRNLEELYDLAESAIALWGISAKPQFIGASENIVYRIPSNPEYILRITEERHRSVYNVRAEMAFMQFLAKNNLQVAGVIPSSADNDVEEIKTANSSYSICMFEKAHGNIIGKDKLYNDINNAKKLGRYLGYLHKTSAKYRPFLPWMRRFHYRDINEIKNALKILPAKAKDARVEFEKAIKWYNSLPIDKKVYGLSHMDAHGDNMFMDSNGKLTLIDFDGCAYNFFIYDLAVPLCYLNSLDLSDEYKQKFRDKLLSSYLEVYPLPQKWLDIIDGFIRLRMIELYIWNWEMFGEPLENNKPIHFTKWRNYKMDRTGNYPVLELDNNIYVSANADDKTKGIISFNGKKYPCLLGRSGIVSAEDKKEGDGATPAGEWAMRRVFYRADKINTPKTKLPMQSILKNIGWCDDANCQSYNKLVELPHDGSYEKMWRNDKLYDLVVELGYNDSPAIKNKGSAIFMHVMHPNKTPTEGCIALNLDSLYEIISSCNSKSMLMVNSERSKPTNEIKE